jgi:Ca2+-binding RTX toxin-like protein
VHGRNAIWRQWKVAAVAFAFLPVLPALASTIVGTNGPETIRGTSGADRISARGGNDKVLGLAGNAC